MSETSQTFTWDDVQAAIDRTAQQTREEMQTKHDQEMAVLRSQVTGALPVYAVPEHAGGPGTEIHPTWSLAQQTESRLTPK